MMQYILFLVFQMRIDFAQMQQDEHNKQSTTSIFSTVYPEAVKYFNSKSVQNQEDQSQLSFQVSYPYEVSRSIFPSAIKKQISYLRANKILPATSLRFIEQSLLSQSQALNNKIHINYESHSYQQSQSRISPQNTIKPPNQQLKQMSNQNVKKKYQNIKPKVYLPKKIVQNHIHPKQQSLEGVTLKPILNYTLNSKVAKKINEKRNHIYKTQKTNVFESLYQNAGIYEAKKRNKRKENIQQKCNKKSSRISVSSTFEERVQKSISKQGKRRTKAQNILEYDLQTGQSLFMPDTSRSKITYLTHFKSYNHVPQSQQGATYRQSCRLNHSQQMTSISLSKDMSRSLQSKYPITREYLPIQNKISELYTNLLWSQQHIVQENLQPPEKSVLAAFLQQINNININSQFISYQFFKAIFKQYYSNLNLFDKAILQKRIKRLLKKDEQKDKEKKELKAKAWPVSKLDHTYKHFFV